MINDAADVGRVLGRQLDITWSFAEQYVLPEITIERCLWQASGHVVTVREQNGRWSADWPDEELHPLPQPTIGWLLWHIEWWWGNAARAVSGQDPIPPADHAWTGSVTGVVEARHTWDRVLTTTPPTRPVHGLMPTEEPFSFVAAWVNFELTKNVSEIRQLLTANAIFANGESA